MAQVPYSAYIYESRDEFEYENRVRFYKKLGRVGRAYAQGVSEVAASYPHSIFLHITLTFRNFRSYRECVRVEGMSQFNRWMLREVKKVGGLIVSHFWVLELQRRGVPHYHYLLQVLPISRSFYLPNPDTRVWRFGCSRVRRVNRVERGNVVKYVADYLGKVEQKDFVKFGDELRGKKKYDVRSYGIFMRFFAVRLTRARMGYVLRLISDELLEMPSRENGYWLWREAGVRYRRRCSIRFEEGRIFFVDFGFEMFGPCGVVDISGSEMDDARRDVEKGEFWLEVLMLKSLMKVKQGVILC